MLDVNGRTNAEIKQLLLRVRLRQLAIGLLVFAAGCLLVTSGSGRVALAGGVLWGVLDGTILLSGTGRALGVPPAAEQSLALAYFLCRVATGVALVVGMLCLKLRVAETFIAFMVLHICFLINLKIFTNPEK